MNAIVILLVLAACLFALAVYSLSVAQTCADRVDGTLRSDTPTRFLMRQQARAERTAAWAFGLGFIASMGLAGTLEALPF